MALQFSFRNAVIASLAVALVFLLGALPAKAQVFGQNQILPSSYLGDGFLISTSTSPAHKLGAALVDLAGSWITGVLGLANGGLGSALSDPGDDRILFWDETSNAIEWLEAGSGLTITGNTLSVSGSGITSIGPAGQGQTGATITIATSTSATNGLTSALTIVGAGDTLTFTPSLSGTLTVGGGGTGVATLTGIAKGNGTSAFSAAVNGTDFTLVSAQSCTNQVITALTASGGSTCSTVSNAMLANSTISGISLGSNLANLTATDSTLTFSGTYNGSTARTIGLNLSATNSWTGGQTFANSTTTATMAIPVGASVITPLAGNIAIDTTTGQLRYSDVNGTSRVFAGYSTMAFEYATSTAWSATTTRFMAPAPANITVQSVRCESPTGTLGVSLYDGTNRANYIPTASSTINQITYTTNNTFTAGESIRVDIGTPASSPTRIACRFKYTYDAD